MIHRGAKAPHCPHAGLDWPSVPLAWRGNRSAFFQRTAQQLMPQRHRLPHWQHWIPVHWQRACACEFPNSMPRCSSPKVSEVTPGRRLFCGRVFLRSHVAKALVSGDPGDPDSADPPIGNPRRPDAPTPNQDIKSASQVGCRCRCKCAVPGVDMMMHLADDEIVSADAFHPSIHGPIHSSM